MSTVKAIVKIDKEGYHYPINHHTQLPRKDEIIRVTDSHGEEIAGRVEDVNHLIDGENVTILIKCKQ